MTNVNDIIERHLSDNNQQDQTTQNITESITPDKLEKVHDILSTADEVGELYQALRYALRGIITYKVWVKLVQSVASHDQVDFNERGAIVIEYPGGRHRQGKVRFLPSIIEDKLHVTATLDGEDINIQEIQLAYRTKFNDLARDIANNLKSIQINATDYFIPRESQ